MSVSSQRRKRTVGIIGGMGPEATVLLMARVVSKTAAADDSDHVAMIVDNNTQIPSRIKVIIEKKGADPGPVIAYMARQLENNGVEALAMPCNTAHFFAPVIEEAVNIPLLNMVEISTMRICKMGLPNRCVGILASPAIGITGIYDKAFSSLNIETVYPSDQQRMLDTIRSLKINSNDDNARQFLVEAAHELIENGADILLIACSELSIIADVIPAAHPRLDTVDVLAEAIIEFSGAELRSRDAGGAPLQNCP